MLRHPAPSAHAAPAPNRLKAALSLRPVLPPAQMAALHVDESGHIPILMYHSIGAPAHHGVRYDSQGLNIAPQTFRHQLDLLYAAHCYPVNMRDILTPHLNVPAGKTPVVITFDDAAERSSMTCPTGRLTQTARSAFWKPSIRSTRIGR